MSFKVNDWVIQTDGDDLGDKPLQVKFEKDTMVSFDGETFWSDSVFSRWEPEEDECMMQNNGINFTYYLV